MRCIPHPVVIKSAWITLMAYISVQAFFQHIHEHIRTGSLHPGNKNPATVCITAWIQFLIPPLSQEEPATTKPVNDVFQSSTLL